MPATCTRRGWWQPGPSFRCPPLISWREMGIWAHHFRPCTPEHRRKFLSLLRVTLFPFPVKKASHPIGLFSSQSHTFLPGSFLPSWSFSLPFSKPVPISSPNSSPNIFSKAWPCLWSGASPTQNRFFCFKNSFSRCSLKQPQLFFCSGFALLAGMQFATIFPGTGIFKADIHTGSSHQPLISFFSPSFDVSR